MSADLIKQEFVPKYLSVGDDKFYRFLLVYAMNKLVLIDKGEFKGTKPELEFLDYYEKFVVLYRREGDEVYMNLAKIFRRAAHRVYRIMLKKHMTLRNAKFLNMV